MGPNQAATVGPTQAAVLNIGREENGEAVLYIRKSKTRAGKRAIPLFSEMAHELKVRRLASPHSMGDI